MASRASTLDSYRLDFGLWGVIFDPLGVIFDVLGIIFGLFGAPGGRLGPSLVVRVVLDTTMWAQGAISARTRRVTTPIYNWPTGAVWGGDPPRGVPKGAKMEQKRGQDEPNIDAKPDVNKIEFIDSKNCQKIDKF